MQVHLSDPLSVFHLHVVGMEGRVWEQAYIQDTETNLRLPEITFKVPLSIIERVISIQH